MATKKNYSKEQLQERSKEIFEKNPEQSKLIATTDGQFFLPNKLGQAKHHARSKKLGLVEIVKEEATKTSETTPKPMNAKEAIAAIANMEADEALEWLEDGRKSVSAAAEKRISELEAAE